MPNMTRRTMLGWVSALGLTPALPSISVTATASATAAAGTAGTSRLLWASLHANAGSAARFASVAGSMGVSRASASGIAAQLAAQPGLLSAAAARIGTAAARPPTLLTRLEDRLEGVLRENAMGDAEIVEEAPQPDRSEDDTA